MKNVYFALAITLGICNSAIAAEPGKDKKEKTKKDKKEKDKKTGSGRTPSGIFSKRKSDTPEISAPSPLIDLKVKPSPDQNDQDRVLQSPHRPSLDGSRRNSFDLSPYNTITLTPEQSKRLFFILDTACITFFKEDSDYCEQVDPIELAFQALQPELQLPIKLINQENPEATLPQKEWIDNTEHQPTVESYKELLKGSLRRKMIDTIVPALQDKTEHTNTPVFFRIKAPRSSVVAQKAFLEFMQEFIPRSQIIYYGNASQYIVYYNKAAIGFVQHLKKNEYTGYGLDSKDKNIATTIQNHLRFLVSSLLKQTAE
ncbi:MAG: hypothetical protein H6679_02745 [Epsilonproteobacteria bacterium]|nr:hypothetical protein [Campylobacterota bacterium]